MRKLLGDKAASLLASCFAGREESYPLSIVVLDLAGGSEAANERPLREPASFPRLEIKRFLAPDLEYDDVTILTGSN